MIVTIPVGRVDDVSVDVRYETGIQNSALVLLRVDGGSAAPLDGLRARAVAALLVTASAYIETKERQSP